MFPNVSTTSYCVLTNRPGRASQSNNWYVEHNVYCMVRRHGLISLPYTKSARLIQRIELGIEMFLFVPFNSFLYAVDILGYSFMSVATLFLVPLFRGRGRERAIRLFLLGNGLLLPFLALQMYFHALIWIASLWALTFPGATWALALQFRRGHLESRPEVSLAPAL